MQKYWRAFLNSFSEFSVYRLSYVLWHLRLAIRLLVALAVWQSIFGLQAAVGSYTRGVMQTYIVLTFLIAELALSSSTDVIAETIQTGFLSNLLLLPMRFWSFFAMREVARKLSNLTTAITTIILVFIVVHPVIELTTNPLILLLGVLASILAMVLYYILNSLVSLSAFWTNEVWGIRFLTWVMIEGLSGSIVPLDLFPKAIQTIFWATPFSYILFFPVQIFLGRLSLPSIIQGMGIALLWIVLGSLGLSLLWRKGLYRYSGEGR